MVQSIQVLNRLSGLSLINATNPLVPIAASKFVVLCAVD